MRTINVCLEEGRSNVHPERNHSLTSSKESLLQARVSYHSEVSFSFQEGNWETGKQLSEMLPQELGLLFRISNQGTVHTGFLLCHTTLWAPHVMEVYPQCSCWTPDAALSFLLSNISWHLWDSSSGNMPVHLALLVHGWIFTNISPEACGKMVSFNWKRQINQNQILTRPSILILSHRNIFMSAIKLLVRMTSHNTHKFPVLADKRYVRSNTTLTPPFLLFSVDTWTCLFLVLASSQNRDKRRVRGKKKSSFHFDVKYDFFFLSLDKTTHS